MPTPSVQRVLEALPLPHRQLSHRECALLCTREAAAPAAQALGEAFQAVVQNPSVAHGPVKSCKSGTLRAVGKSPRQALTAYREHLHAGLVRTVVRALAHALKCRGFNSQPRARTLVAGSLSQFGCAREATNQCVSPIHASLSLFSSSLPSTLSKIQRKKYPWVRFKKKRKARPPPGLPPEWLSHLQPKPSWARDLPRSAQPDPSMCPSSLAAESPSPQFHCFPAI